MYMKWMDTCNKTRVLTRCCFAGSGESVMEEIDKEVEHALAIRIFERKASAGVDCYTC